MRTVNCFGVHTDDVGLRYLVQDKVSNAYGITRQETFSVDTPFKIRRSPHNFKITADTRGDESRTAWVASPVPVSPSVYVAHKDEDLDKLAAFSGAHIIPAWMLNSHTLSHKAYTSNIARLIIPNCSYKQSEVITDIQNGRQTFLGTIILQGDYYFDKSLERLEKLPDDLMVKEAQRIGLANLSNYLRGKD